MKPFILRADEGTTFPLRAEMVRNAYQLLITRTYGNIVSYDELAAVMTVHPQADNRARDAVLKAGHQLLTEKRMKLVNVRNVGYRIAQPDQHVQISSRERKSARRWMRRAVETVVFVALDKLTPEETARVVIEQTRTSLQLAMMQKLERPRELPAKEAVALPSADKLVELFTRPSKRAG